MTTFPFRALFSDEGMLPIVCDGDSASFDTESILCSNDDLLKLVPSVPFVACQFKGETTYIVCGYFMRYLLLDHSKFFDQ